MHPSFFLPELLVFALLNIPALARFDFAKRLVCVQDDLYNGFHNIDPEDINPWCSSYLGIPEYTATKLGGTLRTTVVTTTTTFTPYLQTTTVPTYLTTTTTTLDALQRRDAAPETTPAPPSDQMYQVALVTQLCDESAANKSVLTSVSSACSCLFISPRTVDVSVATTTTRTESAIDYESTPLYVTTLRNATLTETISPTRPPYNTTSPGTGGPTAIYSNGPPLNITLSPLSPSGPTAPILNANSTSPSLTPTYSFNTSYTPSSSPTISYNNTPPDDSAPGNPRAGHRPPSGSSSGFPEPSANVTSGVPIPSSNLTASGYPTPGSNGTSGFPTPSANVTASGYPTPSGNGTSGFPTPSANLTGLPTPSGFPTAPANLTSSGFPLPSSNGTSSGFPIPSGNASTCLFTDYVTTYITQTTCESYVTVLTSTLPPHSIASTKTITQTYTIAINNK